MLAHPRAGAARQAHGSGTRGVRRDRYGRPGQRKGETVVGEVNLLLQVDGALSSGLEQRFAVGPEPLARLPESQPREFVLERLHVGSSLIRGDCP